MQSRPTLISRTSNPNHCGAFPLHGTEASITKTCYKSWPKRKTPTDGPFRLNFSFQNKPYSFSSFSKGKRLLVQLGLISQGLHHPSSHKGTASTKRPSPPSPLIPLWQKQQPKRSRDSHFTWLEEPNRGRWISWISSSAHLNSPLPAYVLLTVGLVQSS